MPQIGERETDRRGTVWEVAIIERDTEEPLITVQYRQITTAPMTTVVGGEVERTDGGRPWLT